MGLMQIFNEELQNMERVTKGKNIDAHAEMPVVMADAIISSEEADEAVEKKMKEHKKGKEVEPNKVLGAEKQPVPKKPTYPKINLEESLFEDVSDYFDNSDCVTSVSFDFGHNGGYDQEAIEDGIYMLLHRLGLEFKGYVDFEDVSGAYMESLKNKKKDESLTESYGMPSKSEVAKFLENSTKELLANEDEGGCCRLVLDDDLCLYVGWSDGFDADNGHDGWEVCAKIAERNDYDWSDFNFLSMPWDAETGEVRDTEVSTPDRSDADWFIKSYKEIRKALDNDEVVLESLNEGRKAKDFVDSKGNVYSNKSRSKVKEDDLFTTIMEELAPTNSYSVKKSKFPDIPQSDRYDYEDISVAYEDDNTGIVINSDDLDFAKQVAKAYGLNTHMSRLGLIIEVPEE